MLHANVDASVHVSVVRLQEVLAGMCANSELPLRVSALLFVSWLALLPRRMPAGSSWACLSNLISGGIGVASHFFG